MKSIKTTIAAIATLASTIAFGGGLYIVSGGDFRSPILQYDVTTTENNQTTNPVPYNVSSAWSFKVDGVETPVAGGNQSRVPFTFQAEGIHKVKVYASTSNPQPVVTFNYNNKEHSRHLGGNLIVNRCVLTAQYTTFTNITFRNVEKVASMAMAFNDKVTTVTFEGNEPLVIGDRAFAFVTKLPQIEIPDNVVEFERCAIEFCDRLNTITLPNKVFPISTNIYYTTMSNFNCLFRKTPITRVNFKGSLQDWNANPYYVHILGEPYETQNEDGSYTLKPSAHAAYMRQTVVNMGITGNNANCQFCDNSEGGLIKLYVNQ